MNAITDFQATAPSFEEVVAFLIFVTMLAWSTAESIRLFVLDLRLALVSRFTWKRRGGIWFGRAGRVRVSFCISSKG